MTEKSKTRREYDVDSVLSAAADRVAAKKLVTGTREPVSEIRPEDFSAVVFTINDFPTSENIKKKVQDASSYRTSIAHSINTRENDLLDENNGILKKITRYIWGGDEDIDTADLFKKAYIKSKKRSE